MLVAPYPPQYGFAFGLGEVYSIYREEDPNSLKTIIASSTIVYAKINGKEYGANPLSVGNEKENIPTEFSLSQNYPNPFNPITTINFTIPQNLTGLKDLLGLNVVLKIYDALGREIVTLVNERKEAGNYSVTFDASRLSSGIYFYRLQSSDKTLIKKMTVVK